MEKNPGPTSMYAIMNIGNQLYSSLSTSQTILFGRALVCPPYVGEDENGWGGHGWTSKSWQNYSLEGWSKKNEKDMYIYTKKLCKMQA